MNMEFNNELKLLLDPIFKMITGSIFFEEFRIKRIANSEFFGEKKNQKKKTSGSTYFAHLKRTSKELLIYKQVFDYVILLRTMAIYQNWVFDFCKLWIWD